MKVTHHYYVAAWGLYIGDFTEAILANLKLAEEEGAPEDALFKAPGGSWVRLEEYPLVMAQRAVARGAASLQGRTLDEKALTRKCYMCQETKPLHHFIRKRVDKPPLSYKSCQLCRKHYAQKHLKISHRS